MALSAAQEELMSASTVGGTAGSALALTSTSLGTSTLPKQEWPRGELAALPAGFPEGGGLSNANRSPTRSSPLGNVATPETNGMVAAHGIFARGNFGLDTTDLGSPGSTGLANAYLNRAGTPGTAPPQSRSATGFGSGGGQAARSVSPRIASAARSPAENTSPGGQILNHLRQQLDLLEARLCAQMDQKFQNLQAIVDRSEKMREVAFNRTDKKLMDVENNQSKLDRRISQLDAVTRGCREEMAEQTRFADSSEKRFFDLKRQLEEDMRQKHSAMDTQQQEMQSSWRVMTAACNDVQRRVGLTVKGLKENMQDMSKQIELLAEALATQQDRLHVLEGNSASTNVAREQQMERATALMEQAGYDSDTRMWKAEKQIEDLQQWQTRFEGQAIGEQGWEIKLQEHAHALTALKSKLELQEQHYKKFDEQIRQDWEGKMDNLQLSIADANKKHREHQEEQETQHRRAHEAMEELRQAVQDQSFTLFRPQPQADFSRLIAEKISAVQELADGALRSTGAEEPRVSADGGLVSAATEMGSPLKLDAPVLENEEDLSGRIEQLIGQLKDMAPKIQEQKVEVDGLRKELQDLRHTVEVQSRSQDVAPQLEDMQRNSLAQQEEQRGAMEDLRKELGESSERQRRQLEEITPKLDQYQDSIGKIQEKLSMMEQQIGSALDQQLAVQKESAESTQVQRVLEELAPRVEDHQRGIQDLQDKMQDMESQHSSVEHQRAQQEREGIAHQFAHAGDLLNLRMEIDNMKTHVDQMATAIAAGGPGGAAGRAAENRELVPAGGPRAPQNLQMMQAPDQARLEQRVNQSQNNVRQLREQIRDHGMNGAVPAADAQAPPAQLPTPAAAPTTSSASSVRDGGWLCQC